MKRLRPIHSISLLLALGFISGCYYDAQWELYPGQGECEAMNVSFGSEVLPILNSNCNSCHDSFANSGGIALDTYEGVVSVVNNGKLLCSIKHETDCSPMPQNGGRLSNCKIRLIEKWIEEGSANN